MQQPIMWCYKSRFCPNPLHNTYLLRKRWCRRQIGFPIRSLLYVRFWIWSGRTPSRWVCLLVFLISSWCTIRPFSLLSVWGQLIVFSILKFYAWFGMLLKGMGENFLLFKGEPLTPDIDGVVELWIFRRRAQNTKIGQKSGKIGPLDPTFNIFFAPAPLSVRAQFFSDHIDSKRSPWKKGFTCLNLWPKL